MSMTGSSTPITNLIELTFMWITIRHALLNYHSDIGFVSVNMIVRSNCFDSKCLDMHFPGKEMQSNSAMSTNMISLEKSKIEKLPRDVRSE